MFEEVAKIAFSIIFGPSVCGVGALNTRIVVFDGALHASIRQLRAYEVVARIAESVRGLRVFGVGAYNSASVVCDGAFFASIRTWPAYEVVARIAASSIGLRAV